MVLPQHNLTQTDEYRFQEGRPILAGSVWPQLIFRDRLEAEKAVKGALYHQMRDADDGQSITSNFGNNEKWSDSRYMQLNHQNLLMNSILSERKLKMTPGFMVWSTRRTKKPLNPPNQPLCATHTRFKKELYFSFGRQMPEISLLKSHSSWISFSLSRQFVSKWKYPLERFFNVDGFILATQRHPWNHLVQASYFVWKKQRSKEVNDLAQGQVEN